MSRRSAALAVYFGQSAGRRVCLKRVRENHARAGSCMLINICDCFLQSGSAPLQLQQHHSGGVFGILPSRCEVESARSRQRQNLEMPVFYFPALAMPHGRKYKTDFLGVSSKTALHKPSLTAASVRLSCAWSLFAFVCCDAAGVRAGSTRAAPTSTPRATRD